MTIENIECCNEYCNKQIPKWAANIYNGLCIDCVTQMGQPTFTNKIGECCVCLENKIIITLKCNHVICNACWYTASKKSTLCPLDSANINIKN